MAVWSRGKLARLSKPGTQISYDYNAFGQRIGKTYSGATDYSCEFCYDESGRLVCETKYSGSGSVIDKIIYLYDVNSIIGMVHTLNGVESTYYFQRNLFGDVIGIYNTNGVKVGGYAYDAWGNHTVTLDTNGIATRNPIRYRGYYYDTETKLYYLNARYYNPEWRRFISPDDTEYLDPESVNGLNLYCYCNNDPVNYADPSGHLAFFIVTAIIGAALGLGITAAVDYIPDQEFNLHWGWYVGAGLLGAAIGAGIGMAVSYYTTGSIASSTGKVLTSLFKSTSLYRSIGPDELSDIKATGKFRGDPNNMEGKYFAKSKKGALEWGKNFKQSDYVKIRVPKTSLSNDTIHKMKQLDAIDDAFYFSDLEYLNSIVEHIWFL